ncbi:hypothetical protein LTR49_010955 [Elasticomyces elasticus]|nr:hypothetical protein LTR49_010955 [Elasticomyces elasticus]
MGKREYDELSIDAVGTQGFEGRFGKRRRHDYEGVPTISQWRCNLVRATYACNPRRQGRFTGLSQEHNLYFVAYGHNIYVYVPQFPTQAIAEKPTLIVPSQPSRPGLVGYLDPREPHTINSLLVYHLGNEEVIATVRDDGDVDVVLVRHVLQAINRRTEFENDFEVEANEIRPIFQSNVGNSAWGLAIHKEARVLAVSSNSHEIRVFKFGLLHENELPSNADEDDLPNAGQTSDRRMDVTQRVFNGDANIPHIDFCNTGDDPEARWLLTTDVSGFCRVMDLRCTSDNSPTAQKFRFGMSSLNRSGSFDQLNAGWKIMFLDRRSFQPTHSFHDAVGIAEDETLPGLRGNARAWDLSDTVENVPDNSPAFTYSRLEASREPASDSRRDTQSRESAASQRSPTASSPRDSEDPVDEDMSTSSVSEDGLETMYFDDSVALVEDDEDPDDEGTEDSISYGAMYGGKRIFGNQPYFYHQNGICEDLPCPVLHASVKNLYLLQPSNQKLHPGAFSPPVVGLANPLRQAVQYQHSYLNMFDRLNMHAYVPALGVVVLASQKGRAVVMALTKLSKRSSSYPAEVKENLGPPKTNYAMRVECILPFAHQELKNERPFAPLHGIAVGPIQGTEGLREERKRWRLMMMYQDHSVLSYEIKRRRGRDSGVEMMVP